MIIEVCAQSVQSALTAELAGANRIELCQALELGGITPSPAVLKLARKMLSINICVLVRPRGGHYVHTPLELAVIRKDIAFCKRIGINGVVVGVSLPNGDLNMKEMKRLAKAAYPMEVVCHRAFDLVSDPLLAMEQLIEAGYHRILTGGGQPKAAVLGMDMLEKMVKQAGNRIEILVGGGVTSENIQDLYHKTKSKSYHLSGKKAVILAGCEGLLPFSETGLEEIERTVKIVVSG
jgi:copper homeostasis protein